MHVFHAHYTILLQEILNAFVIIFQTQGHATTTSVAMEVTFTPTYSAYATLFAMECFFTFPFIVEDVANFTEIASELRIASLTHLLGLLNFIAAQALYFCNSKPIHFMIFFWVLLIMIIYVIVAESAIIKFFTISTLYLTSSFVVFTSENRRFTSSWLLYDLFFNAIRWHGTRINISIIHKMKIGVWFWTRRFFFFLNFLGLQLFFIAFSHITTWC